MARLRASILAGVFPPAGRLPPSRSLASELGVARQTVVAAYEQLAAEGYVRARTGAGTFVADDLPEQRPHPETYRAARQPARTSAPRLSARGTAVAAIPLNAAGNAGSGGRTLLAPGIPAAELFPARAWAACVAHACRTPERAGYPDPQGLPALRAGIAEHLAATRGLLADPGCILVTAGTQQALRIAAEILIDPGDAVWVEDPGYIAGRGAMLAAGATPVPVASDGVGLDVAAGLALAPHARLALVAPSHATPVGGALPVGRRAALLDWAATADAWVLKDDCDSEFRWAGKPLPPLATLDQAGGRAGRVIYCGTFSKTLSPGLRLGFAVFPAPLVAAAVRAHALMDRGPGTLPQAALAQFMHRGLLAPHIRRMRTEYARRRSAVLEALVHHWPALDPLPSPGGLHLTARLPPGSDENAMARAAHVMELGVAPLGAYFAGPRRFEGLVLGFASTPVPLAAEAARRLSRLASLGP